MTRIIMEYIVGVIIVRAYVVEFIFSFKSLIDNVAPYSGSRYSKSSGTFLMMKFCTIISDMNIPMDIAPEESWDLENTLIKIEIEHMRIKEKSIGVIAVKNLLKGNSPNIFE